MVHTILLVALAILLVGELILRVEQRRLSAQFHAAAEEARQAVAFTQTLAANDRDVTDRLSASGASIQRATDRIEAAAVVVASDLEDVVPNTAVIEATDRIEAQAAEVASDLASSQERAKTIKDGIPPGHPGEAADAAVSGEKSE